MQLIFFDPGADS